MACCTHYTMAAFSRGLGVSFNNILAPKLLIYCLLPDTKNKNNYPVNHVPTLTNGHDFVNYDCNISLSIVHNTHYTPSFLELTLGKQSIHLTGICRYNMNNMLLIFLDPIRLALPDPPLWYSKHGPITMAKGSESWPNTQSFHLEFQPQARNLDALISPIQLPLQLQPRESGCCSGCASKRAAWLLWLLLCLHKHGMHIYRPPQILLPLLASENESCDTKMKV